MKFEKIRHENVTEDGTFTDKEGAVEVVGGIFLSSDNGGCCLRGCKCSEGHWMLILIPRTFEGIVEGFKIQFDDKKEFNEYIDVLSNDIWQNDETEI